MTLDQNNTLHPLRYDPLISRASFYALSLKQTVSLIYIFVTSKEYTKDRYSIDQSMRLITNYFQ